MSLSRCAITFKCRLHSPFSPRRPRNGRFFEALSLEVRKEGGKKITEKTKELEKKEGVN